MCVCMCVCMSVCECVYVCACLDCKTDSCISDGMLPFVALPILREG